jgi:DNA-binding winged helix-turn-helix (wHTH) protein/tetratricopeptide (TPR) repeat protein
MKGREGAVYRFGPFLLEPGERRLLHGGEPVELAGKPFDLLVALVSNAGHLATKNELLQCVWPGVLVEEVNLTVNMSAIRKALARSQGAEDWIETIPRQGYRFKGPVEVDDVPTLNSAGLRGVPNLPQPQRRMVEDLARPVRRRPAAGNDSKRLEQDPTCNPQAYQAYLQGRYLWSQRSEPELRRAVEHFQGAIGLDPSFALAHAALADTYTTLGYLSHDAPAATFPVARPHALKAIELDPSLSQAYAALAYIRFYFDWDWAGASNAFRCALDLNPSDPVAHQWHAVFLLAAGQMDEGMHEVRTAQRLDPLSLAINTDVGFHHCYNCRYAEAISQLHAVLGMKRDFGLAYLWLARSYLEVGRLDESLAAIASAEAVMPEWPVLMAARGYTLGVMGRTDEARAVGEEIGRLSTRRFVTAYGIALVHAGLGDKAEAFTWLDKAFAERSHWLVWLRLDPRWKTLRSDPRFAVLVDRMNYPD